MKHTFRITIILLVIFVLSQVLGLFITSQYIQGTDSGEIVYDELPLNIERPEIEESSSFIYILIGVLLGTGILLLLIKFKQTNMWKIWYFIAVTMSLTIAFGAFIVEYFAIALAFIAGLFKVLKPNVFLHNITELFVYAGIAAIFVPVINIFSAFMLLICISIYDAYAVWKSKHMVKLATFQTKSKLFAGLSIPYSLKKNKKPVKISSSGKGKPQIAVLGGGDIAFSLIFTAVVMKEMILSGITIGTAFLYSLIITITVTAALAYLLFTSKRGKFYPAMPFVSVGCFVGYGILFLI